MFSKNILIKFSMLSIAAASQFKPSRANGFKYEVNYKGLGVWWPAKVKFSARSCRATILLGSDIMQESNVDADLVRSRRNFQDNYKNGKIVRGFQFDDRQIPVYTRVKASMYVDQKRTVRDNRLSEGVIQSRSERQGKIYYDIMFVTGEGALETQKRIPSSWVVARQRQACVIPCGYPIAWTTTSSWKKRKVKHGIVVRRQGNDTYRVRRVSKKSDSNGNECEINRDLIIIDYKQILERARQQSRTDKFGRGEGSKGKYMYGLETIPEAVEESTEVSKNHNKSRKRPTTPIKTIHNLIDEMRSGSDLDTLEFDETDAPTAPKTWFRMSRR